MTAKTLASFATLCALWAQAAWAAPGLSVTNAGIDVDDNQNWLVQVIPSSPPGSIAVELAFAIDDAELIDVDVNTAAWNHDNPGNNPFTGTVTFGLWLDLIGDRTFGAFGSIAFSSGDPVELFTIKTSRDYPQTIRYGSAASGDPKLGALMADANGVTYGYTGSITAVPEPASTALALTGLVGIGWLVGLRRRIV